MKQMMIWGNLVRAQSSSGAEAESVDLDPKSWELCCRAANGETKTLAGGVLAYDIGLGPVNTNAKSFYDECQDDKAQEKGIELVKTAKDTAIAFEPPEESFNFISAPVGDAIQRPWFQAVWIRRHDGCVAQVAGQS